MSRDTVSCRLKEQIVSLGAASSVPVASKIEPSVALHTPSADARSTNPLSVAGAVETPISGPTQLAKKKRRRPPPPLMIDAKRAARLFSISLRTWRSYDSAGKVPMPTRLGARVLWHLPELKQWAEAGCPDRAAWNELKDRTTK
jgi:hypothetical protein